MIHYDETSLQLIERELIRRYHRKDYEQYRYLLELRKNILNEQLLAHQEELLPDIIAFNDALYQALRALYDHASLLFKQVSSLEPNMDLTAKCYLSCYYPQSHPYQAEDRQELWDILTDEGMHPLYGSMGIHNSLYFRKGAQDTWDEFMDLDVVNWNEGLDQDLTKDLHLSSAFHNLFEHLDFALSDFIYVRDFKESIKIDVW